MATTPSVLAREAGTSGSTARSVRRRPSFSHLMIGTAAVLAFGLNYLALQSKDNTTLVAIADGAIAEGSPFSAEMIRLAALPSDFEGISHLIAEDDLAGFIGWIVGRSVTDGELVSRAMLIRPGAGDGLRTMSIPIGIEHAAGATLVVGDRVDVISLVENVPKFVATDLEVVSIAAASEGGISGVGPYHVVVGVSAEQALALAMAIDQGSIEVLRSTGAGSIPGDTG